MMQFDFDKKVNGFPKIIFGMIASLYLLAVGFCSLSFANEKIILQLRWDHQFQFAGYYAAKWQGFYREAGLDVEIKSAVTSSGILSAVDEVAAERAHFGIGGADILKARDNDVSLVVVASIFQHSAAAFYTREDTKIDSPSDFLKYKVARRVNDLIDIELQAMLLAEGVDPAKVKAYPHQPGTAHLLSGKVDVMPGYSINIPYTAEISGVPLREFKPLKYGVDFYGDSIFTNKSLVENNADLVTRFKEASIKGWEYALSHPEELVSRITNELHRVKTVESIYKLNGFQSRGLIPLINYPDIEIGHTNSARWERMHQYLKNLGLTKSELDIENFIFDPVRIKQEAYQKRQTMLIWSLCALLLLLVVIVCWIYALRKAVRSNTAKLNRSNEKLLKSEEQYRAIANNIGDYIMRYDRDGRHIYANDNALEVTGLPEDQYIGKTHREMGFPEHLCDLWGKNIEFVFNTGTQKNIEFEVELSGRLITYELQLNPEFSGNGSVETVIGVSRDISERRRVEEELKLSEQKSRTWLEHSPVCTKIMDLDFNLQYMSSAGVKALKIVDVESFYGKPYPFAFFPESFKETMGMYLREGRESGEILSWEGDTVDVEGEELWLHSTIVPVKGADGRIDYLIVVSVDITKRKLTEQKLYNSSLRLHEAVRTGCIGLWDWDLKTNAVIFSTEWKKQIGYESHEIKDEFSEWEKRVHPDDFPGVIEEIEKSIQTINQDYRVEFRFRHKNGSYRWILAQATIVQDETGQPVRMLGSHLDITEQKNREVQKRQAQKMESIGTLAGGIAHDFNNILSSIIGFTELSLGGHSSDQQLKEDLLEVHAAGLRAKALVQQILSFSRNQKVEVNPLYITDLINEALKLIRSSIPASIEMVVDIDDGVGPVLADSTQVHQVVMNICTNAAHSMGAESGKLTVKLSEQIPNQQMYTHHPTLVHGKYLHLSFQDTGTGIDPENIESIFDPYFTTKNLGDGTGLGLATTYGIVQDMGGVIMVESERGRGSLFTVLIPVTGESFGEYVDLGSINRVQQRGHEHILIVDDELPILTLTTRHLEKAGYTVTAEKNGQLALDRFLADPFGFDLIISDVSMPKLTGDALASEVLAVRPDFPILLASGYSNKISEESIAMSGVKGLLQKPITKQKLLHKIRDILDQQ